MTPRLSKLIPLSLLATSATGLLGAQADEVRPARTTAPGALRPLPPSRQEAEAFVRDLDAAFNRGDAVAFLERFDGRSHPRLRIELERHVRALLGIGEGVRTRSTLQDYTRRGPIGIATVLNSTSFAEHRFDRQIFLALRPAAGDEPDAGVLGLFVVGADARGGQQLVEGTFRCPPCNFEFSTAGGWLAVPTRPSETGCMESLLLVSLEHDVMLEAAVHIAEEALPAEQVLRRCFSACQDRALLAAGAPRIATWWPLAHRSAPPPGLSAVRCSHPRQDGGLARLHVIALDRFRYFLVAYGAAEAMAARSEAIDAVVDSFRLLDPARPTSELLSAATRWHSADGRFDGARYVNEKLRFAITGPGGWRQKLRPGGWLFQVTFLDPDGSGRLTARGLDPIGQELRWTRGTAEHYLDTARKKDAERWSPWSPWRESGPGCAWREATSTDDRTIRALLRDDLLVVIEAQAKTAAARAATAIALASIEMR